MRTSKLSTALLSALALLALTATSCKQKSDPPPPPACTLAPLDGACTADAGCCSGNCFVASGDTTGTCVQPAGTCGAEGASCDVRSDCCEASCRQDFTCGPPGSCGLDDGASCQMPEDCCSRICAGPLGAKTCVPAGCFPNTYQCGTGSDCCSGFCDQGVCATPVGAVCLDDNAACSGDTQCCSKVCTNGACEPVAGTCAYEGESCGSDAQCCSRICLNVGTPGATCSSAACLQVGQRCSPDPASNVCCSGTCTGTPGAEVCTAPPAGDTGQACATLNEACALPADCCSQNCQGASGGLKNGTCMPVSSCNAFGDICYRAEDCCSGICSYLPGQAGRCDDAPGGCGQDGTPCTSDSSCCTRKCVDLGTGATACQPAGGCRMTGDYCDKTASCCGGTNEANPLLQNVYGVFCDGIGLNDGPTEWDTRTQDDRICTGGQACNPPGNICGYKASQNCCYAGGGSGKAVCKPDESGILRCFGGPVDDPSCVDTPDHHCCYTGWDGADPYCCKQPGDVCQFREQCCDNAPCTMADDGVLRCTPPQCLPTGATCSTAAPPPSGYTAVQGECCAPNLCYYVGIEVGWRCAETQPPPTCVLAGATCDGSKPCCFGSCTNGTCGAACAPLDAACDAGADCCSGTCTGGFCRPSCVPSGGSCSAAGDCCTDLTCEFPPGSTQGVCSTSGGGGGDPTCAATGASCATLPCCVGTDSCTGGLCTPPAPVCAGSAHACTYGGTGTDACCDGLECQTLDAFESRVPCDPASTGCYCDVPVSCPILGESCSTQEPCCAGTCSMNSGAGPCTSANPADCTCQTAG